MGLLHSSPFSKVKIVPEDELKREPSIGTLVTTGRGDVPESLEKSPSGKFVTPSIVENDKSEEIDARLIFNHAPNESNLCESRRGSLKKTDSMKYDPSSLIMKALSGRFDVTQEVQEKPMERRPSGSFLLAKVLSGKLETGPGTMSRVSSGRFPSPGRNTQQVDTEKPMDRRPSAGFLSKALSGRGGLETPAVPLSRANSGKMGGSSSSLVERSDSPNRFYPERRPSGTLEMLSQFLTRSENRDSPSLAQVVGRKERRPSFRYDYFLKTAPNKVIANDLISQRVWYGEKQCASDKELRDCFIQFILKKENWLEKIKSFIQDQYNRKSPQLETQEIFFSDYSLGERSGARGVANRAALLTQLKIKDSMMDLELKEKSQSVVTCFTSEQLPDIFLTTLWPIFLDSEQFQEQFLQKRNNKNRKNNNKSTNKNYKNSSNNNNNNNNNNDNDSDSDSEEESKEAESNNDNKNGSRRPSMPPPLSRVNSSFGRSEKEKLGRLELFYINIYESLTQSALETKLKQANWVKDTISCIEQNHLPVTISTSHRDRMGFPLVFINKAFENISGYTREEMIGSNCKILQCEKSEKDQIEKISSALSQGLALKVALTNQKKDGTNFCNFLAVRPVFNCSDNYLYVLAVPYDVTNPNSSLFEMKQSEDFLVIICNALKG
jgi:PAS domain S-box-containing protein